MARIRSPRPRATWTSPTPEARKAALAMLWRFDQIRDWKAAVNTEAWRQAAADGSRRCGPTQFDEAETRLEAAGLKRPPEDWFDELRYVQRELARQAREGDAD